MLREYLINTKILTASFLRDKQVVFFLILLPLIFMVIFGSLYSGDGEANRDVVAVFLTAGASLEGEQIDEAIASTRSLESRPVDSEAAGREMLRRHEADVFLLVGDDQLDFYYNPARMQDNPGLKQQAAAVAAEVNKQQTAMQEYVSLNVYDQSGAGSDQLSHLFPGLIALGLASAGLFTIIELFMYYKDWGVLKRLTAAPLNKNIFLLAVMSSRIPGTIISTALILGLGRLMFGVSFAINWLLFLPYILFGTVIMMGVGALITLFAKKTENAMQGANILLTIMIFFSGIYFPVEFLPSYFQKASQFLPLSYLARGFRYIMGVEQLGLSRFLLETGGLLIPALALIVVVAKRDWR